MNSKVSAWYITKRRLHGEFWLVVGLMALLCASSSLAIAGDHPLESTTQLDEFIVCGDPAQQWQPVTSNSIIVWSDTRNADEDIYGYDLGTRSEFSICTAGGDQYVPDIYGNIVVWLDRRNPDTDPDIYGYDLSSHTEFPICTESHGQGNPAIYGSYVVWQDSRAASDNQDIYGYDLNTQTEYPICTAPKSQVGPAIYGDIVVWMDYRNEPSPSTCWPDCNTDIYGYDLSTATEFAICTEGHFQGYPAIYGDTVVWIDKRNGNGDVYAYNLTTHQEYAVCTEMHEQIGVSIGEQWIVWTDMRNELDPANCGRHCNYDLYAYRRSDGAEIPLVTESHQQFQQAVDGNLLFWADERNEVDPDNCWPDCNYDIYGAAILSGEAGFAGGRTQNIGLEEDIVVEFTLPMVTSSVTYACNPDPGGWTETWGSGGLLAANNTLLALSHEPFTLATTYVFTVTGGETVFGRPIEPFGLTFTTYAARIYLPMLMKNR